MTCYPASATSLLCIVSYLNKKGATPQHRNLNENILIQIRNNINHPKF